ncbi:Protein YLS9 [Ananas comosus]|uniref:Protein YLS9 n=1 Tax=Ananas comosus TaxID=4615 RepID=A0A199UV68_ANACO|nr:Protein YLS9 [Ananas comosus]
MADHQRIHPVDVERPPPSAPAVPDAFLGSDKTEEAGLLPPNRPASSAEVPRKKRNRCCRCLCWTVVAVVAVIVLLAATVGILYLVFRPKIPKYSVNRLTVTAFSVDANLTARATFNVTVTAWNPNKKIGIYYDDGSDIGAWYENTKLCNGTFPEFYQGHRNTTVLGIMLSGEARLQGELLSALQQAEAEGSVPITVRVDVPVQIKFGAVKLWRMTGKGTCDLVLSSLSAGDEISIKSSSCHFKLKL